MEVSMELLPPRGNVYAGRTSMRTGRWERRLGVGAKVEGRGYSVAAR